MAAQPHIILGIHITNRMKNALEVQKVFSEFGCHIKTRIGLHDVTESTCAPSGVVLIEIFGTTADAEALAQRLGAIEGVQVQTIMFEH